MRRSTVVADNGSSVLDDYRTSYGTFVNRGQSPIIQAVEDRVAWLTRKWPPGLRLHCNVDSVCGV
jgi:prolyl 4-hydroxylase